MTVIEFFSKNSIDNFTSCLFCEAERICFVGDNRKHMEKYIDIYNDILLQRGIKKELTAVTCTKYDLDKITALYRNILKTDSEFIFDLAGGNELYLIAIGIIYQQNLLLPSQKQKNIKLQKFNIRTGTLKKFENESATADPEISLSVEENVRIYGGNVIKKGAGEIVVSDEFINDFGVMIDYVIHHRTSWNSQTGFIAQGEGNDFDNDNLTASYSLKSIRFNRQFNERSHIKFLNFLENKGIIREFYQNGSDIHFKFKNVQSKKCLVTSGLVLELYIYLTAKALRNKNGKNVFTDAATGVVIDWDNMRPCKNGPTVTNEIDVLLMKEACPVFISCKNGTVGTEELFKLRAVTNEFGGEYAKAVLICPDLANGHRENLEKIARATELRIEIIKDIKKPSLIKRLMAL